jgi:5-oxoprolinase (ATP-hydrolysing)
MAEQISWKIYIDTGGTFTDCIALSPEGKTLRSKVLSSSALRASLEDKIDSKIWKIRQQWNAPDNFIKGFTVSVPGLDLQSNTLVHSFNADTSVVQLNQSLNLDSFRDKTIEFRSGEEAPVLASRLVTRTIPGNSLPKIDMRLATTKGTNALLERKGASTLFITTRGFADILKIRNQQRPDLFTLRIDKPAPFYTSVLEIPERIDAKGKILTPLEEEDLRTLLSPYIGKFESIAVCLMNSYINPVHEHLIKNILETSGVRYISLSSGLSPLIKLVPRAITTDVNAYLAPVMDRYIQRVTEGIRQINLRIMTSSGSLTGSDQYQPKDGLFSGPAGGVTGAAAAGRSCGIDKLISFDMGGTSTDVARYDKSFDYRMEHKVGDATLSTQSLAIETVAAGGGSVCDFDGESLTVGPESAGADPGPACYGAGGPLTITDINLLAGRLDPSNFHFPVDADAAKEAFHELFIKVRAKDKSTAGTEILQGFLDIANEKMAQAIRTISTSKGIDPADYTLVVFGGAGGQHATSIASILGISRIIMPPDAGLLSAYGLRQAQIEKIEILQCLKPVSEINDDLPGLFKKIQQSASDKLEEEGVPADQQIIKNQTLFLRLAGQESTIEIPWEPGAHLSELFRNHYQSEFGHEAPDREIEVESIRIILSEKIKPIPVSAFNNTGKSPGFTKIRSIEYRDRRLEMPVFHREKLEPGQIITSPALILDPYSTLFVEPGWNLHVRSDMTIELKANFKSENLISGKHAGNAASDVINLQLYTNRFTSIAEEMGEMLRRTALSVNVKERLDYSCALLDPKGYLVVNAPHIPVHLGAMGLCVRTLMEHIDISDGDVIITNHPGFGGSHLPDITLITPVFHDGELKAFVANRAHHAEIGGKTPGSMPPDARSLEEEGVVIPPTHLFRKGKENWKGLRNLLEHSAWPSRMVDENIADIQAAVAANHKGVNAFLKLIEQHGDDEVQRYMNMLTSYASNRMRSTLLKIPDGDYSSAEKMDDGSVLKVNCIVRKNYITFDFTGTGGVHPGNLNANPSIVNSVIIYLLRLMIDETLPLNDGLFEPVDIILPESMLNPGFPDSPAHCPAVVGGNIETSQRLTDTLLKAFAMASCSQGTMNNVLFGNESFGYYETVAGGTGAGNGFHGADAVHQHMTNTRATDPEILEHRYPVRLDRFSIRYGSGGSGRWNGGNGLVREMTFLEPVQLSILTQHRVIPPYGLNSGNPGHTGYQKVIRADGSEVHLKWKDSIQLTAGDKLRLATPGGGGYGKPGS